ncbi:MAG: DNA-binding protein [Nitrososphaerales archaeon]
MSSDFEEQRKDSSDDDVTLRMLNAKRMLELRKRATLAKPPSGAPKQETDREIVLRVLVERGEEVLVAAENNYPRDMPIIVSKLADLVRQKKVESITGGELLQFLRAIGLRVSIETSISIEEHGKRVSLADKMKNQNT